MTIQARVAVPLGLAFLLTATYTLAAVAEVPGDEALLRQITYPSVGILGALVCLQRPRGSADRTAWILIAAGMIAWSFGSGVFAFSGLYSLGDLELSVPDLFWLTFYPLVYAGLLLLGHQRQGTVSIALALDALVAGLACAALAAAFGDAAFPALGESLSLSVLTAAYPIGDLILIVLGVGLLMTGMALRTPGLIAAIAGMALFAVCDTAYVVDTASGSYEFGRLVDVGYFVGLLLAAYASTVWAPIAQRSLDDPRLGAPLAVPALSGLAALGVLFAELTAGLTRIQDSTAVLIAGATMLLLIVRMTISMSQNRTILNALHNESFTDALTGLGNRRRLFSDIGRAIERASESEPLAVIIFDLDGFKAYNDSFGHGAGDQLLARIGNQLKSEVARNGAAYRLGGDEFCALLQLDGRSPEQAGAELAERLAQRGQGFTVTASYGVACAPADGDDPSELMRVADRRMYGRKNSSRPSAAAQATDALLALVHERYPDLDGHTSEVASLAGEVAERLSLSHTDVEAVRWAAVLHDVGKVAIPDAILHKEGPLDEGEWDLMRRHTEIGERVLRAVPALRTAAPLVRWSHERWDGKGYPDGLSGDQIPIGASIVTACDAYDAMTERRPYQDVKTSEQALAELRLCSGAQFRPDVVDAVCETVEQRVAAGTSGRPAESKASRGLGGKDKSASLEDPDTRFAW